MVKRKVRRAVSPPSSTLFAAPAPSQSRSRVYSHGYSQPIQAIRGRSRSQSKSSWTTDESGEDEGTGSASSTSASVNYESLSDRLREPSHRRLHLQKVYDLMHLSIGRRDGVRAFRCLRILLKSQEWRPIELWRYALEVATITSSRMSDEEILEDNKETSLLTQHERVARKRLDFLREVSKARTGLQLDVFIEMIPELLALGKEQQALAEIEIVINLYPYRLEPILHLYNALLFLKLSSPSEELIGTHHSQYALKGVSEADQAIAIVPHDLLLLRRRGDQGARSILKEAEQRFETVLTVGRQTRKRGRTEVSQNRSRSRSQSRRSKSQSRQLSRSRNKVKAEERHDDDYDESDQEDEDDELQRTTEDEAEEPQIRIGNDEWARNLARAYLEVLRAPSVATAHIPDSDEEMGMEDTSW